MNAYQSLVTPNLGVRVLAGNCLGMAQRIVAAGGLYDSATESADATKYRHVVRTMPDAVCAVYFTHWGTYGPSGKFPRRYGNWGHVVIWVPGKGFASSSPRPGETSGPYFYQTLAEVERTFNCTFRFWSEDLNGKRLCEPVPDPTLHNLIQGGNMFIIKMKDGKWYLIVPQGTGKPRAAHLPPTTGATNSGIPILDYAKATQEHLSQLRAAVDGL